MRREQGPTGLNVSQALGLAYEGDMGAGDWATRVPIRGTRCWDEGVNESARQERTEDTGQLPMFRYPLSLPLLMSLDNVRRHEKPLTATAIKQQPLPHMENSLWQQYGSLLDS